MNQRSLNRAVPTEVFKQQSSKESKAKIHFRSYFSTLTQKVKKSIRCQKWQKFEKNESEKKIIGEKNESSGKFLF